MTKNVYNFLIGHLGGGGGWDLQSGILLYPTLVEDLPNVRQRLGQGRLIFSPYIQETKVDPRTSIEQFFEIGLVPKDFPYTTG